MEPELTRLSALTVIGLLVHARGGETDLSAVWGDLGRRAGEIRPRAAPQAALGVTFNFQPAAREFDYLAGFPVEPGASPPPGMASIEIPAQTYAVFPCTLKTLMQAIHQANHVWLPASAYEHSGGPELEYYGDEFDPADPASRMDFYVPVRAR